MNRRRAALACRILLAVAMSTVACGRATAKLTELQRLRSGALDVVVLSPRDGLQHGKDAFTVEFRSANDGRLVDVGTVRGGATMPMGGIPMLGSIDVNRTDVPGRYAASAGFEMAGTWRMTIQWAGPAGQGSVTFSRSVQ